MSACMVTDLHITSGCIECIRGKVCVFRHWGWGGRGGLYGCQDGEIIIIIMMVRSTIQLL